MNLFETLAQFAHLEPDPGFSEKSKRMILASPQKEGWQGIMRGMRVFFHTIETGAALALAGFLVLLATGGFSGTRNIAPVQYSVIDPGSLHAEAEAIDMQIELANVSYAAVSSTVMGSTAALAAGTGPVVAHIIAEKEKSVSAAGAAPLAPLASSTATSTLSVDQALQQLSQ